MRYLVRIRKPPKPQLKNKITMPPRARTLDTPIPSSDDQLNSDTAKVDQDIETQLKAGKPIDNPASIIDADSSAGRFASVAGQAKAISGVVLLATAYCTLGDLRGSAQKADEANQGNAVRQAANVQTISDQIKAGDTNAETAGGVSASFDGAETSSLYQADTGQTVTGSPTDLAALPNVGASKILFSPVVTDVYDTLQAVFGVGGATVEFNPGCQ